MPPLLSFAFLCIRPLSTKKRRLLLLWLVHAQGARCWLLDVDGAAMLFAGRGAQCCLLDVDGAGMLFAGKGAQCCLLDVVGLLLELVMVP